jgi:hypothetical protein
MSSRSGPHIVRALTQALECATRYRSTPWVDWANYWGTGDGASRNPAPRYLSKTADRFGIDGALLDLEYQRIELIKFNLLDNSGTYPGYVRGWESGHIPSVWSEMRLPSGHPQYEAVGGAGEQHCKNELIRFRNLTGICNDTRNPAMGSSGTVLARNVDFSATFPELGDERAPSRTASSASAFTPSSPRSTRRQAGSMARNASCSITPKPRSSRTGSATRSVRSDRACTWARSTGRRSVRSTSRFSSDSPPPQRPEEDSSDGICCGSELAPSTT